MVQQTFSRMHALVIPTQQQPILVPSAMTAEIISVPKITPIPFSQLWLLGVIGWRRRAVPVISFECLLGQTKQPVPHGRAKLAIFHPLQGRSEWDFFAILASADPQPYTVNSPGDLVPSTSNTSKSPFVATTARVGKTLVIIPDMEAIHRAFYPGTA